MPEPLFAALDVVMLSRIQFALTIMFHYLFPPLTIGLGVVLVWLGLQYVRTGDPLFRQAQKFWTRIYALNFALGVATGIVMEFQFGTNWATYSEFVGDVFGSALAAEGVFAFFLESGFLAVLVFGWDRVSPRMHFFSTCMVSLGSIFSAVWIVVANSWQQTPAGHKIVPVYRDGVPWVVDGVPVLRAEIQDFWAMVFNPTSVIRLSHVLTGSFIVGGAFVCSVGAWYLLRGRHTEFAKRSLNGGLVVLTLGAFTAGTGHLHGQITYSYQPAKLAACEAHFVSGVGDECVIGWPDPEKKDMVFNIAIPGGYSFLLTESFSTPVVGLDKFRPEDQPPVLIPFTAFRMMVGIGSYLIALTMLGCYFRWKGTLYEKKWLLWLFVVTVLLALACNHAGWVCAEVGRQPWVVYPPLQWDSGTPGVGEVITDPVTGFVKYDETAGLRTDNAVSRAVIAEQVLASIIGFGMIYFLLFVIWLTVLNRKIQAGPDLPTEPGKNDLQGFFDAAAERPDRSGSMIEPGEAEPSPSPALPTEARS